MQNLKKNWSVVLKVTKIWWNLTWALQSLQNLQFDLFLLYKVFNVWPKKVQRSYLSWQWKVMQNLKKNWLVLWKMTWGIWQIFKLWWDPFVQSRKGMTLKFTEELCVMTMKNNGIFEEELTCHFRTDMRKLTNFHLSTRKSKNCSLIGCFDQSI